jgi:hypothetical protein
MLMDILGIIVLIIGVIALAAGILWGLNWITLRRAARASAPADERSREERLKSPDWDAFRGRFACAPPPSLRALCADHERLLMTGFDVIPPDADDADAEAWSVQSFTPIDARAFESRWDGLDDDLLEIASDDMGNVYLVRITGQAGDPLPVRFFMHDGDGELEPVADSLEDFLRWPRRAV